MCRAKAKIGYSKVCSGVYYDSSLPTCKSSLPLPLQLSHRGWKGMCSFSNQIVMGKASCNCCCCCTWNGWPGFSQQHYFGGSQELKAGLHHSSECRWELTATLKYLLCATHHRKVWKYHVFCDTPKMSGTCSGLVASLAPLEGGRFETQPGLSIITLNPIMNLHQWDMPVQSAGGLHKNNQMCIWARPL